MVPGGGTDLATLLEAANRDSRAADIVEQMGGRRHLLRHGRWPGDVPAGWVPPPGLEIPGPYEQARGATPEPSDGGAAGQDGRS